MARNSLRALLGMATALILAACQASQIPPLATILPAATEIAPQTTAPAVGQLGAERLPQLALKPKINDDPTQVVGMLSGELQSLLGPPEFLRRDMTAQVWQYRPARCVVDLFLYGDDDASLRVVYYEVRPLRHDASSFSDSARRGCFAQLLRSGNAA